jgi:hypothetical protein
LTKWQLGEMSRRKDDAAAGANDAVDQFLDDLQLPPIFGEKVKMFGGTRLF